MAIDWWSSRPTGYVLPEGDLPHSADLKVSFLGHTNGNATIQVRNHGSQTVYLNGYVEIHARDTNRASPGTTGQRNATAALPRAHANLGWRNHLHPMGVDSLWKCRMVLDHRTKMLHFDCAHIRHIKVSPI